MVSETSIGILMKPLTIFLNFIRTQYILLLILLAPIIIFIFTLGRYYGFYYDNHYFNLLALDLMNKFQPYFYLGSHYSIRSSLYSYLVLPLFYIFGPTDFSMELLSTPFHLLTIFVCFKLGERFFNRIIGLIFAFLVSIAPINIINIYTWPEYSLITFLNTLSICYFLMGFQEISKSKLIISSILYSLSCSQAIYSLLLLPFFIIYSLVQIVLCHKNYKNVELHLSNLKKHKFLSYIFYLMIIVAFLYLIFLLEAMYIKYHRTLYYFAVVLFSFLIGLGFKRLPQVTKEILKFCFLFIIIVATVMLLLDLFVQLDIHLFEKQFGYYRNTLYAGGFGTERPAFIFRDKDIEIFGKKICLSVLSSIYAFRTFYTRGSLNLLLIWKSIISYYKMCFPLPINILLIIGIIGLSVDMLYKKYKKYALDIHYIFPIIWILGITLSFINVQPYHMIRIYILPMPYFFAALGIYYSGNIVKSLVKIKINNPQIISTFTTVALALSLNLSQFGFLVNNVYKKYKYDKAHSMYYQLFHGWSYGRSYKEVGEFLLKDAPLKRDGKFRSIFIYTIAPDTAVNICAVFYNNIDWYTQNQIKIVYDVKYVSNIKYGSPLSLAQYLYHLFSGNPDAQVIYFADFFDTKDNFSFFSKIHNNINPYKIVNDDESFDYDCILYKFERNTWRDQIKWKEYEKQEIIRNLILNNNLLF